MKFKLFKKTLSLLLCLAFIVSVAGCGNTEGNESDEWEIIESEIEVTVDNDKDDKDNNSSAGDKTGTSTGNTQNNTSTGKNNNKGNATEEAFFDNVPSNLKGTKVKFATWIDHKSTDYAYIFKDFKSKTGIEVEIVPIDQVNYVVKIAGLIASGNSPDVIVENGDFPRTLALAQPITESATGINSKDSKVWNTGITDLYTINGKSYFINGAGSIWNMAGAIVYYNKSIFSENGIKTPQDYIKAKNWTLDSFLKICEDLKQIPGITPAAIDADEFLRAYDACFYSYNSSTGKFTNNMSSDKAKWGWTWLQTAREKGLAHLSLTWASNFGSGTTGMGISGAYGTRKKPGWFWDMDTEDIGYAYMPKETTDGTGTGYPMKSGARAYGIAKGAPNPKGAGYFLRYFLSDCWYDMDDMFKDKDALAIQNALATSKTTMTPGYYGLYAVQYADIDEFGGELLKSSASQVNTNLKTVSNKLDICIQKGNKLINDAK